MKRYKRILLLLAGIVILIFIYLDMKAVPAFSLARPSMIIPHGGKLRMTNYE